MNGGEEEGGDRQEGREWGGCRYLPTSLFGMSARMRRTRRDTHKDKDVSALSGHAVVFLTQLCHFCIMVRRYRVFRKKCVFFPNAHQPIRHLHIEDE